MDVDFPTRTIFLGDITHESAALFVKAMHLLQARNDFPIHILMNSHGGSWSDALAVFDCIQDADTIVTIEVLGQAMSAAVPIVQACDHRFIHPNATVMIHNGTQAGEGDVPTFVAWGKRAARELRRMYEILAYRSKKPAAYWRRKCANGDFIIDAEEALALGLFDEIVRREARG